MTFCRTNSHFVIVFFSSSFFLLISASSVISGRHEHLTHQDADDGDPNSDRQQLAKEGGWEYHCDPTQHGQHDLTPTQEKLKLI